jgi:transcriptional regulator with XRE-family HTH domain
MTSKFYSTIGANIIKARNNLNITQEELASKLGINRVSVGRIESGKQRLPVHFMHTITQALKIELMDLFSGIENINPVKRTPSPIRFSIYQQGNLYLQFESEVHIKDITNEDCTIIVRSGYSDLEPTQELANKILKILNTSPV